MQRVISFRYLILLIFIRFSVTVPNIDQCKVEDVCARKIW